MLPKKERRRSLRTFSPFPTTQSRTVENGEGGSFPESNQWRKAQRQRSASAVRGWKRPKGNGLFRGLAPCSALPKAKLRALVRHESKHTLAAGAAFHSRESGESIFSVLARAAPVSKGADA